MWLCNLCSADLFKTTSPWHLLAADGGGRLGCYTIVLVEDVVKNLQGDSCLREVVEGVGWTVVLPGGMVASVDGTRCHRDWGCAYFS